MGGFGFHVYQPADAAKTLLEVLGLAHATAFTRWSAGNDDTETRGILQKDAIHQVAEDAVTPEQAEELMTRLSLVPAAGEQAAVIRLEDVPPYLDHYGHIVAAIPVADESGGPIVGWLLFGIGNE